jgi:hypothetical protein
MAQPVDSVASHLERLNERVRELERRISALEAQREKSTATTPASSESVDYPLQRPRPPATWRGFPPAEVPGGVVPVLGKAVMGIAGAYLLRAIAESGIIPKLPVLIVAIAYAALWMVWAVRTHSANRFASITYGITSALILSPLLWESNVRFQVLAPTFTAFVLAGFVVLALALSWKRNLQAIPWIATFSAVTTALALIIATHELVPLTAALLAMAFATEAARCLDHPLSLRAVPAIAADFAVWLLVYILTSTDGVPEGYHASSPAILTLLCLSLLAIYGGSVAIRTFARRRQITAFEIGQGIVAFALAAFGVMRASQASAAPVLSSLTLLVAAVCYWGALSRFTDESCARNRRVSATYAAALTVAGSYLLLSPNLRVLFLSLAAIASAFVYSRTGKLSLGMHSSFYLAAAAIASSLLHWIGSALAGTVPVAPDSGLWILVTSSALCYLFGSQKAPATQSSQDQPQRRLLWALPAALVGFAAAALAVVAIIWFAAGRFELSPSRLAVVRTIVNCALALTLGFLGSRWKHLELGWVAYAAVAFGTLKLLFEDLRFGNAASLVVSLLFYGLILILLPRLTHRSRTGA